MSPEEALEKYWGYTEFRPLQREIIASVLDKKDTLAILPTGGGKSICFQVPAMMQEGACLIITPLIALMKDQVEGLKKKNIPAIAIHSGHNFREVRQHLESASRGTYKFIYVSPERLESPQFLEYLPFIGVNLVAVDEAHCISQWGYDFRPAYLKIAAVRSYFPDIPVLALTASATPRVQHDICDKLEFHAGCESFIGDYTRPNLSYSVFSPPAKENKIIQILQKVPGTSIAYCRSRKRTKELSQLLQQNDLQADFYHAGLSSAARSGKQDEWMQSTTRVICCTNAFGMGIDKPDVRTVIHYDLPDALENYYQEAGRVGRDGKKAYAILLLHEYEIDELKERIPLRFPDIAAIRKVYGAICSFIGLPAGKGKGLSFAFDVSRFVEKYKLNAILVTGVLKILDQESIFSFSDGVFTSSTVAIIPARGALEDFERDFPEYDSVIKGLLRSYENILDQPCPIDEFGLARFIGRKKEDVISQLKELDRIGIIEYIPPGDAPRIFFYHDRVPAGDLIVNMKNIGLRKAAYEERLSTMIEYATQKEICRSVFISRYFGDKFAQPCGVCDVCLSKKVRSLTTKELKIVIRTLEENDGLTYEEIHGYTHLHKDKIWEALGFLKQEEKIITDEEGKVTFKK